MQAVKTLVSDLPFQTEITSKRSGNDTSGYTLTVSCATKICAARITDLLSGNSIYKANFSSTDGLLNTKSITFNKDVSGTSEYMIEAWRLVNNKFVPTSVNYFNK